MLITQFVELYLDVDDKVNWIFVKQLLSGEKAAYKLHECRFIELPRWSELDMKTLLPMALNDQTIRRYLRDDVSLTRPPSRSFLATIIHTTYGQYFPFVIKEQTKKRHGQAAAEQKGNDIKLT